MKRKQSCCKRKRGKLKKSLLTVSEARSCANNLAIRRRQSRMKLHYTNTKLLGVHTYNEESLETVWNSMIGVRYSWIIVCNADIKLQPCIKHIWCQQLGT